MADDLYPVSPMTAMEATIAATDGDGETPVHDIAQACWKCAFAELRKLAVPPHASPEVTRFLDRAEREVAKR
jgi:hypothetical protein